MAKKELKIYLFYPFLGPLRVLLIAFWTSLIFRLRIIVTESSNFFFETCMKCWL